MGNIKLTVAYDGSSFAGFQRQPKQRTIQGELETALRRITGYEIQLNGAGRTDAGVHAEGQVVNFITTANIPPKRWVGVLNHSLPEDIAVLTAEHVSDSFHARYDACWKCYRYYLATQSIPNVFTSRYQTRYTRKLQVDKMKSAASYLLGTHDFTALSSSKTRVENRVRTLYECQLEEVSDGLIFTTCGNGFLYNMVRIMVGTLVEVGLGRLSPEEIPRVLHTKDRSRAGKTFAPEGLTLLEVSYEPWPAQQNPAGSSE